MGASPNGKRSIGPIEGLMFDLDGTLVLSDRSLTGYQVLPGAIEVLAELNARGIPFVALTNGSAYPPAQQAREASTCVRDTRCRPSTGRSWNSSCVARSPEC